MTPLAALFIGSLVAALTIAAESSCLHPVSCPCGSSGKNYTFCINSPKENNPCERWSRCASCEDGLYNCSGCPKGLSGPTCETDSRVKRSRLRRQLSSRQGYPTYGRPEEDSCPELEAPKLGSIRCVQSGRYSSRICTGRCLPGYTFKDRDDVTEMQLRCRRRSWTPLPSFPPCESRGHCDLELQGRGTFNCTTGMRGTRCDIRCGDTYVVRHFCFPGKNWEPSLPYCAHPKVPGSNPPPDGRQNCRCENGGSCDRDGNCICPVGRTGTYCETVVPEKHACPDPGILTDGERKTADGRPAPFPRTFDEGETIIFSCKGRDSALEGSSLLTCTSEGSWSAPLPRCVKPSVVACSDPGKAPNADRLNTDGSSSDRIKTYDVGQSIVYTCHRGYALQGSSMLTCQDDGQWSNNRPHCTRLRAVTRSTPKPPTTTTESPKDDQAYCLDPGTPRNGERTIIPRIDPRRRGLNFPQGSRLEFSCSDGYELEGDKYLYCLLDGEWSSDLPLCEEKVRSTGPSGGQLKYCENPGPISNGQVTLRRTLTERRRPGSNTDNMDDLEYPQGTQLDYVCETGFALRGAFRITCDSSGLWSADPPSCVEECGRTFMQMTRRITHGTKTVAGEWPWVVAIAVRMGNFSQVICGGALLGKRTVVTAAHCLSQATRFILYFGKHNRLDINDDDKVHNRTSSQLIIHPRFNKDTFDSDIALIRFSPGIRFTDRIQPICLPTRETVDKDIKLNSKGYVTGWGLTEKSVQADELLMANLPVLPTDACKEAYARNGLPHAITDNMFCAGFENGVVSACTGDSGSPLVFYDRATDRHTLEGIVSFGVSGDCGLPGRYTVFTIVLRFISWIYRNL